MKQILEQIKELIQKKGITDKRLAQRIDMQYNLFSGYLSGKKKMPLETLLKILDVLKISKSEFFKTPEEKEEEQITIDPFFADLTKHLPVRIKIYAETMLETPDGKFLSVGDIFKTESLFFNQGDDITGLLARIETGETEDGLFWAAYRYQGYYVAIPVNNDIIRLSSVGYDVLQAIYELQRKFKNILFYKHSGESNSELLKKYQEFPELTLKRGIFESV